MNDIEVIYTQFKVQLKVEYIVLGTIEHFENTLLENGKHINMELQVKVGFSHMQHSI